MTIPHSPYAPTNPNSPQPVGVCDRCGFLYPLSALREQMEWSGTSVIGLGFMVCPRDLDVLQQNGKRTVYLGDPEPKPLRNARPPNRAAMAGATPRQFVLDDPDADILDVDFLGDNPVAASSLGAQFTSEFDEEYLV